jgi:hypothetical protein
MSRRIKKNKIGRKKKKSYKKNPRSNHYTGVYGGICYASSLELAFIMKCIENNISIKKFDLQPIEYELDNKQRLYYPDFIINENQIVEIKHFGFIYEKKKDEIEAKRKYLEFWCIQNKPYSPLFITNKDIDVKWITKAKRYARKHKK